MKKEIEFSYHQNQLGEYIHLIGKTVSKSAHRRDSADVPFTMLQQNTATNLETPVQLLTFYWPLWETLPWLILKEFQWQHLTAPCKTHAKPPHVARPWTCMRRLYILYIAFMSNVTFLKIHKISKMVHCNYKATTEEIMFRFPLLSLSISLSLSWRHCCHIFLNSL